MTLQILEIFGCVCLHTFRQCCLHAFVEVDKQDLGNHSGGVQCYMHMWSWQLM